MARFLTTSGIASDIEHILRKAETYFVLVTPYLKLSTAVVQRLRDANKKGIQMTIIYGKEELANNQKEILNALEHLEMFYFKNLHAKCYHNEKMMVIASMNLHEFSERNNREMGVGILRDEDPEIFNDAIEEINSIKNASALHKEKLFIPQIEKPYTESHNFHLPLLQEMLNWALPDITFELSSWEIKVDLPDTNTVLKVDYRLIIKFPSTVGCERFRSKIPDELLSAIIIKWYEKHAYCYVPVVYKDAKVTEGNQFAIANYWCSLIVKLWAYL